MLEENRLLKAAAATTAAGGDGASVAPLGDEFLDQKRAGLKRLESTLATLRTLNESPAGLSAQNRATIQKSQQIVLKALLLDRENEQLLLKSTMPPRRDIPQARPTLNQVRRLYQRHDTREETAE